MIFLIAVGVISLPILLGGLLAWGTAGFATTVEETKEAVENIGTGYNPAITFGHEVKVDASEEEMLKEARLHAARKAASTPRGANMRIGRKGFENLRTAGDVEALDDDPMTAVRIAAHHGWDGARTGAVAAVAAAAAPIAAGAAPTGKISLVPGKDYEFTEITDGMPGEEKRKVRIANSKAKSAAYKAAKAAGVSAVAAPVVGAAAPVAAAAAAPVAQSVNIEPPQYIEMTDDMPADEKRKARIANSKAKSAFNKALKAAGVDPKTVEIVDGKVVMPGGAPVAEAAPAAAPVAEAAPAAASAAAAPATASNIPLPELVEITDDMAPDEKRKLRIANSKAKSAYNKALKAAGIDPKSLK